MPVDGLGDAVTPVQVEPTTARVTIPVFSDRQSRTLPVSPVVTGTPAAGFEVASVTVEPSVVTVEGDADELVELERIDTVAIPVTGLSSDSTVEVALATPTGVIPLDRDTVEVTITLRQVTATRNFDVGLSLVGASSDLVYEPSVDRVIMTVGGSVADLDRLTGATLVAFLDVTGLDPGTSPLAVTADLPAGVAFVGASPATVTVVIRAPEPPPTPTPTTPPTAAPSATPTDEPPPSPSPGG